MLTTRPVLKFVAVHPEVKTLRNGAVCTVWKKRTLQISEESGEKEEVSVEVPIFSIKGKKDLVIYVPRMVCKKFAIYPGNVFTLTSLDRETLY